MSRYVGSGRVLAIGLMAASPTAAFAGAWTLDAGQGQAIVTGTPSTADMVFGPNGKLQSFPRYSKDDLQALIEYGATDAFTVIMSPSLQHVSVAAPFEGQRTGLGYTDFGGRLRLFSGNSWVVSVQAIAYVPGTFDRSSSASIGYYDPEADLRGLVGYSFKAGPWPAFVDFEVAQRVRVGGPPSEFHGDATFGIQPSDRWLFLIQSFNVISEGAGTWGIPGYSYYKLQPSAVYALTPAASLQLGAFTTYTGRNSVQENGLVLSVWYKF
jgi:protein XagA